MITVKLKKTILAVGILTAFIAFELCNNDNGAKPEVQTPPAQTFGAFQVTLEEKGGYTSVLGRMYDGPYPPSWFFEEIAASGSCRLYKRIFPFCDPGCGGSGVCVKDDSCQPYPSALDIGTVTVSGFRTNDGKTSFSMDPLNKNYQYTSIAFPPCNEGDVITLSAAGSSSMSGFTLNIKGISPLTLLNDTINLIDGQPIDLRWTPPTVTGISTIFVLIDVSFHGGTKAKIECDVADNGSLTIPAALLDNLKTFGIAGYPKLEISRLATSTDTSAKVKIVIESKVAKTLYIPGLKYCSGNGECPEGQTCESNICK